MPDEIVLTDEQEAAVDAMWEHLIKGSGPFSMGGLAGTGKTVCIKHLMGTWREGGLAVVSFTGKAVSVLRRKGIGHAQTIHSLIYAPVFNDAGKLTGFRQKGRREVTDEFDGIVVDEASMLNARMHEDLLSYDIPVVFVGDHGQLEPIGDNPGVMEDPDIRLERIHRQAEGNPIITLAHAMREGHVARVSKSTCETVTSARSDQAASTLGDYDLILCGFNKTRRMMNQKYREGLGHTARLVPGERMICLRNNKTLGIYNGMVFTVDRMYNLRNPSKNDFEVDITTDDGRRFKRVDISFNTNKEFFDPALICDYGYCMTVHKAQGSEASKVLVFEEIWTGKWDPRRWRYTAATRAKEKLTWVNA